MAEQTESSWTESRFRQRLVGASVVVALAVLLLPLWLDGSGIDSLRVQSAPEKPKVEGTDGIEVPQPPGDTGEPLENPPTSLFPDQTPIEAREGGDATASPAEPAASSLNEAEVEVASAAGESREGADQATSADSDASSDQTSSEDREDSPSESGPADGKAAEDDEPSEQPEETETETDSASSGENLPESSASGEFVVQLGSFSDERNARALAKSVESSGFDVSVTPLFSEQGTVWRVRVGPYATRDLASEATERLRQRIGRDGLVMTK
ncbi:SPOR domain-containing protein [Guyparkeria sp. SCN-R1]|uniref:SPOR domain-containing protein n=1 Tax=Guyparkeria sp. SCN-R1 TaxID=2341113 RepID=UPI000F655C32|nr:SPOR domain-containing protein [Guyparkeria sp. SCN-R1]RRQ23997.1 SPOR domain-containing protein [Guyparkeria sp. SCN-R1]